MSCYLNVILTYVSVLEIEISTAWISRTKQFQFINYFIDMFICSLSNLVFRYMSSLALYWGYSIITSENFSNSLFFKAILLFIWHYAGSLSSSGIQGLWKQFPVSYLWHMHVLVLNTELFKRSFICYLRFLICFLIHITECNVQLA